MASTYFNLIAQNFGLLVGLHVIAATLNWVIIRLTDKHKMLRFILVSLVILVLGISIYYIFPAKIIMLMSVLFFFQHFGFIFRAYSSLYWFRADVPLPTYPFYLIVAICGNSQHFGAGTWEELNGRRMSVSLLLEFAKHVAYTLVVFLLAWGLWETHRFAPKPLAVAIQRSVFFVIGLELLTHCGSIQTLIWSLFGKHRFFFGNFAWFTSKHIGQFWSKWNQPAIQAFRELSIALKLTRKPFLNVMAVFIISGAAHQWMVSYYSRQFTYGTFLSFLLHGSAVFAFGALYRKRRTLPKPLVTIIFNPVVTALFVFILSQPFVMDLYGGNFVIWTPSGE